ncbi:MAG: TIGR02147 family protein [Deltaproteobacteria bacterium]|nr:TIGR02147 family protein [Deltaproteobacteria bacterium]
MIGPDHDYRQVLSRELEVRCQRNPRYSLRSFARDLGMAPAQLSDILRGRYGISRASAANIADRMSMGSTEKEIFCDLVESKHARSQLQRKLALARLAKQEKQYSTIALDSFQAISDWYHFAILELVTLDDFQNDLTWIANTLGITTHEAKSAIERLKRLDMLVETKGELKPAEDFTATPSGIPSDAIRKFHQQILKKAGQALHMQPVERRDYSAITFAIDRARLPEAKRAIQRFRKRFCQEFSSGETRNDVYVYATQFFSLRETL